jgi:hypothetical protein
VVNRKSVAPATGSLFAAPSLCDLAESSISELNRRVFVQSLVGGDWQFEIVFAIPLANEMRSPGV